MSCFKGSFTVCQIFCASTFILLGSLPLRVFDIPAAQISFAGYVEKNANFEKIWVLRLEMKNFYSNIGAISLYPRFELISRSGSRFLDFFKVFQHLTWNSTIEFAWSGPTIPGFGQPFCQILEILEMKGEGVEGRDFEVSDEKMWTFHEFFEDLGLKLGKPGFRWHLWRKIWGFRAT